MVDCEAAKEVVWMKKFFLSLEVAPFVAKAITNSRVVANAKKPRKHQ